MWGAKSDWDFWNSDIVKNLMELIFNICDEFRWNPEGSVSQIHSPHLHVGAAGIFSNLLRSVLMLKREREREREECKNNEKLLHLFILVKLQPWFLSLRRNYNLGSCACSEGSALGQNTLMMMMINKHTSKKSFFLNSISTVFTVLKLMRSAYKILYVDIIVHPLWDVISFIRQLDSLFRTVLW